MYDQDVMNYTSGLSTPLTNTAMKNLNDMVKSIKRGMYITRLSEAFDIFYLLAGETSEVSLKNLSSVFYTASTAGTSPPVFDNFTGYTGDGLHGRVSTNFIPSTNGTNVTLNNNSIGIYSHNIGNGNNAWMCGYLSGSSTNVIALRARANAVGIAIHNFSAVTGGDSYTSSTGTSGLTVSTRASSSQFSYYINSSLGKLSNTNSQALSPAAIYITCANFNGAEYGYSTAPIGLMFMGRYLTATDVATISTAIQSYLIASSYYFLSATINDTTHTQIDILFDHDLDASSVPATSAFTVSGKTVSGVTVGGKYVRLTVTSGYSYGDAGGTVVYTKPSSNPIKATNGVGVASFTSTIINGIFEVPIADRFDNGKLILTFDDGQKTNYTVLFPYAQEENFSFTTYINKDVTTNGLGPKLSWTQVAEMMAAGIDIQSHTYSHSNLTNCTTDSIRSEIHNLENLVASKGLTPPTHLAYVYGAYNATVISVVDTLVLSSRCTGSVTIGGKSYQYVGKNTDKWQLPGFAIYESIMTPARMSTLKNYMDICKQKSVALFVYAHDVNATSPATDGGVTLDMIKEIVEYAKAIGLDIIDHDALYQLLN